MGSGSSSYTGTQGSSQPYAESYHVMPDMIEHDKHDPDIYDPQTGYFKNPTAFELTAASAIDGGFSLIGHDDKPHRINGRITYVLDLAGRLIAAKRVNPNAAGKRAPHPTLIGGRNPCVQCAGMIEFQKGKILSVDTVSGHYKPAKESLTKVMAYLDRLYATNPELFHSDSSWRRNDRQRQEH